MVDLAGGVARIWRAAVLHLPFRRAQFQISAVREAVLSVIITVILLIGVVWNLPDSPIKRALAPLLRPVASSTGLQQNWQMYAPDPVATLEDLQVRVRMSDGRLRIWQWQPGNRLVGQFAWYHWQKLKEQVIRRPPSRKGIAHWVVRELTAPGEHPMLVLMVVRRQSLPPPGKSGPGATTLETLYRERLDGIP